MSLYYFVIQRDHKTPTANLPGLELTDMDEAWEEATKTAEEVSRDLDGSLPTGQRVVDPDPGCVAQAAADDQIDQGVARVKLGLIGWAPTGGMLRRLRDRRGTLFIRAEQPFVVRPDGVVTIAGRFSDPFEVQKLDMAASIADQACFLQGHGDRRHAGASNAHHLGQKLLRDWQLRPDQIVHPQQPFAGPRFNTMNGIAGRCLLRLPRQEALIVDHQLFHSRELIYQLPEPAGIHDGHPTRNL